MQPVVTKPIDLGALRQRLKYPIIAAAVCAGLLCLSITWIDEPLARFFVHHQRFSDAYRVMLAPSFLPLPLAVIYLLAFACRTLSGRRQSGRTNLYLTLSTAILTANTAKDELNLITERVAPLEWLRRIGDHVQPFTDNGLFGGFPAGHAALIAAPMFVLWWRLPPRFRPVWMAITAAVMIGLVGCNFYFAGDVIGGFFLGLATAAAAVACFGGRVPIP